MISIASVLRVSVPAQVFIMAFALGGSDEPSRFDELGKQVRQKLEKIATSLDNKTMGQTIGFVGVSQVHDSTPEEPSAPHAKPADANSILLQALLSKSLLVANLNSDETIVRNDDNGRFSRKVMLQRKNVAHLREKRKMEYLIVSQVLEKSGKISLEVELFHLPKARRITTIKVPLFRNSEVEVVENVQFLPPLNLLVLGYAIESLGQKVNTGECWDLPASVLAREGISVTGYTFGNEVSWAKALPGDVLTIDNGTDHHVMVLLKPAPVMKDALILHQNVGDKRYVLLDTLSSSYAHEDIVTWRPGLPE